MRSRTDALVALLLGCVLAAGVFAGGQLFMQTNAIQQQRHMLCVDQNRRHDNTIAALRAVDTESVAKAPSELSMLFGDVGIVIHARGRRLIQRFEEAQLQQSVHQSTLLIDALAPRENCNLTAPG